MSDQKYIFSEDYEFWGTFSFQYNDEKFENVPGHLCYAPNKLMELVLSISNDIKLRMLSETKFDNIEIIRANLVDKNQNSVHAILLNNQLVQISKIHPSFLLLCPQKNIHATVLATNGSLDVDQINLKDLFIHFADIEYILSNTENTNLLREFLWNESIENIDITDDFKIGLLNLPYWNPYTKIHHLIDGPKDILDKIDIEISRIIGDNSKNTLKVRAKKEPRCFARFSKNTPFSFLGISDYLHKMWGFLCFLMIATHEKTINFKEAKITIGASNYEYTFFFLYNQTHYFMEKRFVIYNRFAPFRFLALKENFSTIIQNFYRNYNKFEKILNIMRHNYEKEYFDYTNTAALIDCLSFIAEQKKYKNSSKYQDVLNHWANSNQEDIDCLNSFLPNSPANIGEKISNLRADVYHFKTENNQDFHSYFYPTEIFELVISDYIFEEIGVSDALRKEYRNFYMDKIKRASNI